MGKTTKSDEDNKEPGTGKGKGTGKKRPKLLGPATVLKPVLIGAAVLGAAQAILPQVP